MSRKHSIKKKIIALVLSLVMIAGTAVPANAALIDKDKDYALEAARVFDKVWDAFADVVLNTLIQGLFTADSGKLFVRSRAFPTVDEYFAQEHEYFYEGSDGKTEGDGWKLGYSSESIIPVQWRKNADGKSDPNGMCLNKKHYFGGYFGSSVKEIYDDERVYVTVLSAGADSNANGKDDVIILMSIDNIGIANGNVRDMREAVSNALIEKGLEKDDIIAIEVSATHAHTVIEALGMSLGAVFLKALSNHFFFKKDRSIEPEMHDTICEKSAKAAADAYDSFEDGTLRYFETDNVNDYFKEIAGAESDTLRDKIGYGAGNQDFFAGWYFESDSGVKTVLANTGLHPTFAGRNSGRVCADVPYYMWKTMQDAGYQFQFIQGSQAAIGLSGNYTEEGAAYAESNKLSYDEWVQRYGKKYADKHYEGNKDESGEAQYFNIRATGYSLTHFILDSLNTATDVAPVYDVKMGETVIPLDYGIMYLAAKASLFGYNTVKYTESETGFGIITEIGYVQIGEDVVMLMLPGEISPAITFGTEEGFEGDAAWQGPTSWNGTDWKYDSLADYAKAALGSDKKIIAMGIANDEIGYVMPDPDTAKNFLTKTFLASKGGIYKRGDNEELMSASPYAGSALTEGYIEFFESVG